MLNNGAPIPVHFPTEAVTSTTYTVGGELGYIAAAPASAATWTLPVLSNSAIVEGAPFWIRNAGPGTITLVPAVGDTLQGPTTVAPGTTMQMITDGTSTWKVASVSQVNGGPAPAIITVNPAVPTDGVTTFQTIQSAIDSLGNKAIRNTIINAVPGLYTENLNFESLLALENQFSTSATTVALGLNGDAREIAGVGIAYDCAWNRNSFDVAVVGGGANSRAVLAGVAAGTTLTVTAAAGTNPNFVAAGVVPGDRVLIRHNQQAVAANQFAIYTIQSVAATVLTFTTPLAFDVNAVSSAMTILPNVEIRPADVTKTACSITNYVSLAGLFFNATGSTAELIAAQASAILDVENCVFYGGGNQWSTYRCRIRADFTPFGNCFFNASIRSIFGFGESSILCPHSLICPADTARAVFSDEYATVNIGSSTVIGGNVTSTSGLLMAQAGSGISVNGYTDVICTGGKAFYADEAFLLMRSTTNMRIRGFATGGPSTGIFLTNGSSFMNASSTNIAFDCANAAASFLALDVGNNSSTASPCTACLGITLTATPASSTIAQVVGGSVLTVKGIASTAAGLNSNGFVVRSGSKLVWTAAAGSTLAGGGGTGVLFDLREASDLAFSDVASTRTFTGYGTMFSLDTSSRAFITDVTCTTSNAGANTNLLVNNASRAVLGDVTFVVSGANIGISEINGSLVIRQVGTTLTNGAATPVLGPSVGTPTGDLITPVMAAGSTNLAGSFTASTTAGASAGGVTLTFSSAFAVAPKSLLLTAFGAAQPTNLRVVSLSTTAAVLALTTPAGAGTAFGVAYQVNP